MEENKVYSVQWDEKKLSEHVVQNIKNKILNCIFTVNTIDIIQRMIAYLKSKKDLRYIKWEDSTNYYRSRAELLENIIQIFPIHEWTGENNTKIQKVIKKIYHVLGMKYPEKEWAEFWSEMLRIDKTLYFRICDVKKEGWWDAGDYGDDGSCFWGDRAGARDTLEEEEQFRAVLFYDGALFSKLPTFKELQAKSHGWGRCWLWYRKKGGFILFNFYNQEKNRFVGNILAQKIAESLGLHYKSIQLDNNGEDSGTLYLNDGRGYLLTTEPATVSKLDFRLRTYERSESDDYTCDYCGVGVSEDMVYFSTNDEPLCERCFNNYYFVCDKCGETEHRDNMLTLENSDNCYCKDCIDKVGVYSDYHGKYINFDDHVFVAHIADNLLLEDNVRYSEYEKEWIFMDESDTIETTETYTDRTIKNYTLQEHLQDYLLELDTEKLTGVLIVYTDKSIPQAYCSANDIISLHNESKTVTADEEVWAETEQRTILV